MSFSSLPAPSLRRALLATACLGALAACSRPAPPQPAEAETPAVAKTESAGAPLPEPVTRTFPPDPKPGKVDWFDAPATGDVASIVREELLRGRAHQRGVLVYVGAKWCEPCEVFHKAAADGLLDAELGKLRVVAFDLDRDRDRLAAAGYKSDMIPLFAMARPDGTASGRQFAGSVKGPEAIDDLKPKVGRLLHSAMRIQSRGPFSGVRSMDMRNLPRLPAGGIPGFRNMRSPTQEGMVPRRERGPGAPPVEGRPAPEARPASPPPAPAAAPIR